MIQGHKRQQPSQELFSRISAYDVYRFYLGDFQINTPFCNTLRGENNPSLIIRENGSDLYHFDNGDTRYRGNCVDLVMQKYFCDYGTALKWIKKDFGLSDGTVERSPVVTWKRPEEIRKRPPKIHVVTRNPTLEEIAWWNRLLQSTDDLKRENIYFPREIYRNYQRLTIDKQDLTFCYYYPGVDKWKIYRPNMPKRTKETPPNKWKWDTNLPFDYIENLDAMQFANRGLLTAKKKDRLYLSKILETDKICNVQAEDPACVSDATLSILQKVPEIWGNGDNDDKGHQFTDWLDSQSFRTVNGDFPDMGIEQGHETVLNYFKIHGW